MVLHIIHKFLIILTLFIIGNTQLSLVHAKNKAPIPTQKPKPNEYIKVISNPKFLPIRKPAYPGPFGEDYNYVLNQNDRNLFSKAVNSAELKRWNSARRLVDNIQNPLTRNFITWLYLKDRNAKSDFRFRALFIRNNHTWPEINLIRSRAEKYANDGSMSSSEIIDWFSMFPPLTGPGLEALANAYKEKGDIHKSEDLAKNAWHNYNFTQREERRFLSSFAYLLNTKDHEKRVSNLIWNNKLYSARRNLKRVSRGFRRLAEARIALNSSAYGVDSKIARIPNQLRKDPGLTLDRVKWRRKRGKYISAKRLIINEGYDDINPTLCWKERHILSRHSVRRNKMREAYEISSNHKANDSLSIFEAEWMSGWLSKSFFNNYDQALKHFYNVYDAVSFPVSLSKASYWIGQTLESAEKSELARPWYEKASMYNYTFYGQLASEKIYRKKIHQPLNEIIPNKNQKLSFNQNELVQVLRILAETGQNKYLKRFTLSIATSGPSINYYLAAEMISNLGRIDLGVWVARKAEQKKIILFKHGYPVPDFTYPLYPEKPLILSVIRQESNFDISATSHAGAKGLMQLMPATARVVSKRIKERYDRDSLTIDPSYNIRLGSAYLYQLINEFNGSYIMALAGYNAGPHRVKRWIRLYGDPRKNKNEIDWIEQIPFNETRNYVKRVIENLNVYRELVKE
ncbi:MAG: lytic transglycosylase domain-containing protein [Pseudomonadota bacterium]|nr:lytic transglycosylase domain-containing protein [Pseudomonadota bacterium]